MPIEFKRYTVVSRFSPPGADGAERVQEIEFRRDPLTGRWSRINIERARRPKQTPSVVTALRELAEKARDTCPFCPERVETSTPTFTLLPYRRLHRGDCWVFPNLYPFSKHHAVTVFTPQHYKPLGTITPEEFKAGINASIEYLNTLKTIDRAACYPVLAWNHLPPAGASIIHPHFQILADERPPSIVSQEIEASEKYAESGGCFWEELLVSEEERGERFVKSGNSVSWITSFSPIGNREVMAIFKGKSSLDGLGPYEVEEFVEGLASLLKYYSESGLESLNMLFYSGPLGDDISRYFYLHARIIARPSPSTLYVNDDGFLEKLCAEPVIDMTPEDLANALKRYMK
jgi:galactose-1-phosphate uridylyltransferase